MRAKYSVMDFYRSDKIFYKTRRVGILLIKYVGKEISPERVKFILNARLAIFF
jgi:hypothetical protein